MAEKPTFTPGPWTVAPGVQVWSAAHTEQSHPLMVAELGRSCVSEAEQDGNARLIAAAPKMYEALEQCKYGAEYPDELGDIIDAALAAARGEEA